MEFQRSRTRMAIARALAAILGAVALVALAPAVATAAPAYPIHHCDISIDPPNGHVKAGATFRVSGSYYISTNWTVSFNGTTRKFTGPRFTTTFRAPKTASNQTLTLSASCGNGNHSLFQLEVLASGLTAGGTGGQLPNTGGPSAWWLILAGLAGASGSFLMWRGRRRQIARIIAHPQGKHLPRR